ncbi:hypothetical protein ACIQVE_12040 [Pseudomonas sp. NPDC098747]|uniref:hypothetical protein n=1 Tax=Pseudomonas sp. NPDC098747 TaxID=3364487 RepID=UPI00383ABD81
MPASQSVGRRILKSNAFAPTKSRLALACSPFLIACLYSAPAFSADIASPATLEVMGRAPTATTPTFTNKTAPGKNPAVGDQLEATYVFADPDGDAEDVTKGVFQWKAEGSNIANATTKTFTPTTTQLKQFLTFDATPGTNPLTTDPARAVAAVTSPQSGAPVLPSRTQLAGEYTEVSSSKSWGDAYMHCAGLNSRLPSVTELQTLFTTYTRANTAGEDSENDINKTYGWGNVHWSSAATVDRGTYVYLGENGRSSSNVITNTYRFACAKFGAPERVPSVTAASVPATAAVGTPVTAVYTYNGNATIPDRSRFQWYTATANNGSGKVLATGAGATTKTYTPDAADAGKYLMVEITPASYDTVVGTIVSVVSAQIVSSLTITGLTIEKPTAARGTFEAKYTTITGGTEADLTYQWYWKGAAVNGATAKTFAFSTLTIPSASAAEELKVEVSKRPAVANRLNRVTEEKAALATATLGLRSSIAWNAPLGQGTWFDIAKTCARQSNGNKRPGTTAELQALHASLGNMAAYGVNTANSYWTGTKGTNLYEHQTVNLNTGSLNGSYTDSRPGERGLCVSGTAPAAPAAGRKWANGASFSESDFPSTGFEGAYFEFEGLNGRQDFTYVSTDNSKAYAESDDGEDAGVKLKSKGRVNIEIYNVAGGNPTIYTVNPKDWFTQANYKANLGQAKSKCSAIDKGIVPLTKQTLSQNQEQRMMGGLFSEWGNMGAYGWPGMDSHYWTQAGEHAGPAQVTIVRLTDGKWHDNWASSTQWTVCMN